MSTGSFPGVKSGRGVTLTLHPLSDAVVMKGWSYTSTPSMGPTACTDPQCLYKGALYLFYCFTTRMYRYVLFTPFVSGTRMLSSET